LGGFFATNKLSKDIRHLGQALQKFRQFTKVEQGYAKKSGESMLVDIVSDVADAGGSISETSKVPETRVTISQVTVTANEYGQKIPYTGKLEDFSEISLDNHLSMALRDSMSKTLDAAAYAQFILGAYVFTPTGSVSTKTNTISSTGSAGTIATRHMSWEDFEEISAYLSQVLKAPLYDGENYIGVINSYTRAAIRKDSDWKDAKHYGDPAALFTGEVGKIGNVRCVEETYNLPNTLGTTTYRGSGIVFGRDAVAQVIAVAEELRSDPPTDLGRSKSIGWYALLGYKLLWTSTTAGEARTMRIHST